MTTLLASRATVAAETRIAALLDKADHAHATALLLRRNGLLGAAEHHERMSDAYCAAADVIEMRLARIVGRRQ